ncbi:unnamed protein product, partial [Effrenium voratum]
TALLSKYDMAVVDEALQLSAEEFGRLHAMYLAAGKRLLLLSAWSGHDEPTALDVEGVLNTTAYVALSRGHYGAFRARQVRRPAALALCSARQRLWSAAA